MDRTMLEKVEASAAVDLVRLVGNRKTQHARFPSERSPFVADEAMHLMRASRGRRIDGAVLEMIELAKTIRRGRRVGRRIAEKTLGQTGGLPFGENVAKHFAKHYVVMHFMSAGRGRPIDRSAGIVARLAAVWQRDLRTHHGTKNAVRTRVILIDLRDVVTGDRRCACFGA